MGHQADKYDVDGDYFKSQIMNYPLGGGMSGRFFLNLREDKGWTYGANSMFMGSDKMGAFAMFTSVKTEATDSALIEIFNEFNSYRTIGISEKELQFTKDAFLGREALKYETAGQKLGFLNRILTYDLDKGYIESQANILNSITKSDIDAIAKVKIKPEKMAIVIVGNKYLIKKKLKNLESSTDGLSYNFKIKRNKILRKMKRKTLTLLYLLFFNIAYSQSHNITSAAILLKQYKSEKDESIQVLKLKEAKDYIDAAYSNESTSNEPKCGIIEHQFICKLH